MADPQDEIIETRLELSVQLATLSAQLRAALEAISEMKAQQVSNAERNRADHAEVKESITELRLQMQEKYATLNGLQRVDENSATRHEIVMNKLAVLEPRITTLEKEQDTAKGFALGAKGVAAVVVSVAGLAATLTAILSQYG